MIFIVNCFSSQHPDIAEGSRLPLDNGHTLAWLGSLPVSNLKDQIRGQSAQFMFCPIKVADLTRNDAAYILRHPDRDCYDIWALAEESRRK